MVKKAIKNAPLVKKNKYSKKSQHDKTIDKKTPLEKINKPFNAYEKIKDKNDDLYWKVPYQNTKRTSYENTEYIKSLSLLTIEELPELSEISTVAIQILLEDKCKVLLVKLLIRNNYLLDYRIHKCAQCHSPKGLISQRVN